MPCSAVTLSLATIAAVVSVALLAIAFSTDNWIRVTVNREELKNKIDNKELNIPNPEQQFETNYLYFTRTKGLFRICFPNPKSKPKGPDVKLYLSPVETYCMNIDYFIPDEGNKTESLSTDEMAKVHMGRATIGLFICAFLMVFCAFWSGVAGCWRRSSGNITTTAILLLFACLFSAGAMGLWHGVEYYETKKLAGEQYQKDWPEGLKSASKLNYDWSFYLSWISVGFSLLSSLLFAAAASCITNDKELYSTNSANGQYVMTVYPQKQQGYAYGYAAYPTPAYAYQGNQYPPYNY